MTNIPNIDDIILKAKDIARRAGEKTEEIAEAGKLKINILTLNAELRKKYTQIGEYVFECSAQKQEPGEILEKYLLEASDIKAQIKLAEEELSQNGKKKVCSACGTQNEPDNEFCKNCGNKL